MRILTIQKRQQCSLFSAYLDLLSTVLLQLLFPTSLLFYSTNNIFFPTDFSYFHFPPKELHTVNDNHAVVVLIVNIFHWHPNNNSAWSEVRFVIFLRNSKHIKLKTLNLSIHMQRTICRHVNGVKYAQFINFQWKWAIRLPKRIILGMHYNMSLKGTSV